MTGPRGSGPIPEETGHGGDTVTVEPYVDYGRGDVVTVASDSASAHFSDRSFLIRSQYEQTFAKMEQMMNAQAGTREWLPDDELSLFSIDRRLPTQPWWRFVRFRRWLCELIAGRDFDVE